MSKFTQIRDAIEDFVTSAAHKVVVFLQPTVAVLEVQLQNFAADDLPKLEEAALTNLPNGEKAALDAVGELALQLLAQQGKQIGAAALQSIVANAVHAAQASLPVVSP